MGAALDRSGVVPGDAARHLFVENARKVLAVLQRGGTPGIADDAARHIAGYGIRRRGGLCQQAAAAVQNALADAVLRAVLGVVQRQMLAPADHAADIGIGGKVQRVGAVGQRYGCCWVASLPTDRQDVVTVNGHCGQQALGAGDGVAFRGHSRNDLIVADNAARQRLGLQAVAAAARAKFGCGHTLGNHVGTQHAAHAVAPGNQLRLNGNGG